MRKRVIFWFVAAISAWAYYVRAVVAIRQSPFGDEFGSIAFPVPTKLWAVGVIAALSSLIGFFLLLFDLVQWSRKRHFDKAN